MVGETNEENQTIAKLYKEKGWPLERIGNTMGMSHETVRNRLEAMGIDRGYNYDRSRADHDTKLDIINKIQQFAKEHGHSPRISDWEGPPSASTIRNRFGSWKSAIEKSGLESPPHKNKKYSDDDILSGLRRIAANSDGTVTVQDVNNDGDLPHSMTIIKRFGSFNDAKEKAGVTELNDSNGGRPKNYSKKDLLVEIRRAMRESESNYIKMREWDEKFSPPSSSTIRKRFGSWSNALEFAKDYNG